MAIFTYSFRTIFAEVTANLGGGASTRNDLDPSILFLPSSNWLQISFTGTDGSGFDTFATQLNATNGARGGGGVSIWDGDQYETQLALLSNGTRVLVGTNGTATGSLGGRSVQLGINADLLSNSLRIVGNASDDQDQPAVAGLTGDRFVVVYRDQFTSSDRDIRMTVYNNAGTAILKNDVVVSSSFSDESDPSVAALTIGGGFVVAWTRAGSVIAQRFDSDGNVLGAQISVAAANAGAKPQVAGLLDGGFAVVFRDAADNISLTIYDAAGAVRVPTQTVNLTTVGLDSEPAITRLSNGLLVISWTHADPISNDDLYMRAFDANGGAITGELRYQGSNVTAFFENQSTLTSDNAGNFYAAWRDSEVTDGSGSHIGAIGLSFTRTTLSTDTGENLAGDELLDIMFGYGGNDTLSGGENDDTIDGGAGNDQQFGGNGNDTIYFDPADNPAFVDGGAGTDKLLLGANTAPIGTMDLVARSFEEAIGEVTDTGANAWHFIRTRYVGAWQVDFIDEYYDSNVRIFRDFDNGDLNAWTEIRSIYTAGNLLDASDEYYDNGTRNFRDFDQSGVNPWSEIRTIFAAGGLTDFIDEYYDNSTRILRDLDQGNANAWSEIRTIYTAGGLVDFIDQYNDNGTRVLRDFDQANANIWTEIRDTYTAGGLVDLQDQYFDNGTRTLRDFDQGNLNSWTEIRSLYTAGGLVDYIDEYYDNGTRVLRDLDQNSNQSWSEVRVGYTAGGLADYQDEYYDNGTRVLRDYDQANAFAWNVRTTTFNASGTVVSDVFT